MKAGRTGTALVGAIIWVLVGLGVLVASAGTAAATGQSVHVDTRSAEVGQLIHVTGSGWAPVGETVQMQLCGQDALNLSNDCDQADQYTAAIRAGGIFYGALDVRLPPSPCPCVVAVTSQGSFSAVDVPITIVGAPTRPIPPKSAPEAPVAIAAKLLTPMSASSWFGGPKKVTLQLRVTNLSPIAYESPTLSVTVGKGPNPSGFVVAKPLAPLAVGATQVLTIPVTIPAFTAGHYTVRAQVMTGDGEVATVAGTSSYPWGLFVAGALVIQAVLLLIRNRVRARLGRRSVPVQPLELEPVVAGATEPVPVIDLRVPALSPGDPWTITNRLALLFPGRSLTFSIELLACPALRIQRTTVCSWAEFATSPWDTVNGGRVWAEMAIDSPSDALVPGGGFSYRAGDLELQLHVSPAGPSLPLGDNRTVLPVRVEGFVSLDGERTDIDIEAILERTWVPESADAFDSLVADPTPSSLTYGYAASGDSFYLLFGADGEPDGWLVRDGLAATIVHADRRVEEHSGPYPRRVVVELSDDLGRRANASGTATNGMVGRDDEGLALLCRTEWDVDGRPAVGEDRSKVPLSAWRSATRAGWGELAEAPS